MAIFFSGDICFEDFTYLNGQCLKKIVGDDADGIDNSCKDESLGFGSLITGIPDALLMVDDFDDIFEEPKNFSGVDQFRKSSNRTINFSNYF